MKRTFRILMARYYYSKLNINDKEVFSNHTSSKFVGIDMKGNHHLDIDSHHAYMAIPI